MSIFSECDEIRQENEGDNSEVLSHNKPYESRKVLSNKKARAESKV